MAAKPISPSPASAKAVAAARAALASGEVASAWRAVVEACRLAPGDVRTWLVRADVARAAGDVDALAQALGRAIPLTRDTDLCERLELDRAWALAHAARRAEALAIVQRLAPVIRTGEGARLLARVMDGLGLQAQALPFFARAAEAAPEDPAGWFNLGVAHRAMGDSDKARSAFDRALALDPVHGPTQAALAALDPKGEDAVERLAAARMTTGEDRSAQIDYALFQAFDGAGRLDEAWDALARGSAAAKRDNPWSAAEDRALVDALADRFPPARFEHLAPVEGRPRPIFVVGLPRTGTTLVERVLAAHSHVTALGELDTFGALLARATGVRSAAYASRRAVEGSDAVDWAALGRAYRAETGPFAQGRPVIVDKLPQNWLYAGPIALALPDAHVVQVSRGSMDALFGAYKQLFRRDHRWSYALDDLADHYRNHRRLMDHWRSVLGPRLVQVSYEALVRDPATWIPRLVEACGLAFEPACLEPHLAEGPVRTLSVTQVRQPITARGVGAWRRYAAQLEPLRARLEADGFVDESGEPA
jgi:tetratricopeptide (TPR) repeat protein